MRHYLAPVGAVVGVIALVALAITGVYFVAKDQGDWEASCHAQGGHVTSHTGVNTGVGVGANGKVGVVTTSDTTYYCLKDGRILSVH